MITCRECEKSWYCMERSRLYPCSSFVNENAEKNPPAGTDGNLKTINLSTAIIAD